MIVTVVKGLGLGHFLAYCKAESESIHSAYISSNRFMTTRIRHVDIA